MLGEKVRKQQRWPAKRKETRPFFTIADWLLAFYVFWWREFKEGDGGIP